MKHIIIHNWKEFSSQAMDLSKESPNQSLKAGLEGKQEQDSFLEIIQRKDNQYYLLEANEVVIEVLFHYKIRKVDYEQLVQDGHIVIPAMIEKYSVPNAPNVPSTTETSHATEASHLLKDSSDKTSAKVLTAKNSWLRRLCCWCCEKNQESEIPENVNQDVGHGYSAISVSKPTQPRYDQF